MLSGETPDKTRLPCLTRKELVHAGARLPFFCSKEQHLHVPPILPTHIVQRMADLPQAVGLYGFH